METYQKLFQTVTNYFKSNDPTYDNSQIVYQTLQTQPGEMANELAKREFIAKIISAALKLSVTLVVSYYSCKWIINTLDPTRKEKQAALKQAETLFKTIGIDKNIQLTEYEMCIASNLVDPLSMSITWKHIGGLRETIEELQQTVILPFRQRKLFQGSSLLQPPKGCLLYGPPGCGKTLIAKATAKAAGARFINLQVSSLVDKWYGESQKRAQAVFTLAMKLQPVIVFIDEIDSFLRSRSSEDHEATAMVKTQFMSFWDGVMTDQNCRVMIMGATNRPHDVDAAILRRMPSMFYVGLPDSEQRQQILKVILHGEQVSAATDLAYVADHTEGYSGSDLKELCRTAALYRVLEYIDAERIENGDVFADEIFQPAVAEQPDGDQDYTLREINTEDFKKAIQKMKQTKGVLTNIQFKQIDLD